MQNFILSSLLVHIQAASLITLFSAKIQSNTFRTITSPVVLYGCETWSLTFRDERRLRVFENRVLREIFGPRRDEVTGEWRRLHKDELYDLYCSTNVIRVIRIEKNEMGGACSTYWGK